MGKRILWAKGVGAGLWYSFIFEANPVCFFESDKSRACLLSGFLHGQTSCMYYMHTAPAKLWALIHSKRIKIGKRWSVLIAYEYSIPSITRARNLLASKI